MGAQQSAASGAPEELPAQVKQQSAAATAAQGAAPGLTDPVYLKQDLALEEAAHMGGQPMATGYHPPAQLACEAASSSQPSLIEGGKVDAISDYKIGKTLGQGAYGKVKLATDTNTGHSVAVKVIDRNKLINRPLGSKQLAQEINTMKILRHSNVVRLYEVIHTPAKIFMVMEYASGGDLLAHLNQNGRLAEPRALELFSGMIEGLHFCHKLGVCHRDLKLENLLLVGDQVKIADFGMAALAAPDSYCKTLCGSPDYAAPEILREAAHYDGELSDLWSCGVILYALLCRRLPFQAHQGDVHALFASIKNADYTIPSYVTELPADLITRMLTVEPTQRWNIMQVKQHPWIRQRASLQPGGRKPIKMSVSHDCKLSGNAFPSFPSLHARTTSLSSVGELPPSTLGASAAAPDVALAGGAAAKAVDLAAPSVPATEPPRKVRASQSDDKKLGALGSC